MQEHRGATEYLALVTPRLKADGFKITEHITYKNQLFRCIAKRTRFQFEFSGFAEFFFIFAEFPTLDRAVLKEFSSKCFSYAKWHRSIPLPRGLFEGIFCFPVALCDNANHHVTKTIRSDRPPMHWAANEFPVIYNLKTQKLYYFENTPLWGYLYWDYLRTTIVTMLSP